MKKYLGRFLELVKKIEIVIIVAMAGLIVSVIAAQVFLRFFFNKPFAWAEELATITLIYLSFISADVVYKEKGHISVEYFVGKLPKLGQGIINIFIHSCIVVFFLIIIPQTLTLVIMQYNIVTSAAFVVPKSFFTLPVLIVFPSMLLTSIYFILEEIEKFSLQ